MKKLVVIDGKSVFYRGYYAMANLSLKDGTPTGGVYGFMAIFLTVLEKLEPTNVIVAWDKSGTNTQKRKALYSEYKANRKSAPADFYDQVPLLHQLLDALGVPLIEMDGYEADDLMGTLAVQAEKQQVETVLVTGDLDLLQLISPLIKVYVTKTGFSKIDQYDRSLFESKYGVKLEQFVDYKALRGDSSDNIPGVAGVGPKTAVNLLNQYGDLEGIYQHLNELKPNLAKKLADNEQMARLSQQLVKIFIDAPIELDLSQGQIAKIDPKTALAELDKLEFRSLKNKLAKILAYQPDDSQPDLFNQILIETIEPKVVTANQAIEIITDEKVVLEVVDEKMAFIIVGQEEVYQTDLAQDLIDNLAKAELIISSDIKGLLHQLAAASDDQWHNLIDLPFVWQQTHNLNQVGFLLDSLQFEQLDSPTSLSQLIDQAGLYQQQLEQLKTVDLEKIVQLDSQLTPILFLMERRGVKIDLDFFADFNRQISQNIDQLTEQIYDLSGQEFNLNSPKQLAEVLFDKLQLPTKGLKKNSNGFSTSRKTLDLLEGVHPIIGKIKQLRELTKLRSTYVEALPKLVDQNSRLHSSFHQNTTATGRLSSTDPNLQNIPIRSSWGHKLRQGLVADQGKVLISADYAQFELRIVAALAQDQPMLEVFEQERDIHTEMAAQLFEIEPDQVSKDQRRIAKTVNFGVLYGISARSLALGIDGLEYDQAKQLIDKYFETRAKVAQFMEQTLTQAKEQGFVETFWGRRRPTPDVKSSNFVIREAAKRASGNMPIQGTGADLMKRAMIEIEDYLAGVDGANQILQIHDSILIEAYPKDVEVIKERVSQIMLGVCPELKVKLTVDVKTGSTWLDL